VVCDFLAEKLFPRFRAPRNDLVIPIGGDDDLSIACQSIVVVPKVFSDPVDNALGILIVTLSRTP